MKGNQFTFLDQMCYYITIKILSFVLCLKSSFRKLNPCDVCSCLNMLFLLLVVVVVASSKGKTGRWCVLR